MTDEDVTMKRLLTLPLLLGLAALGACANQDSDQPLEHSTRQSATFAEGVPGGTTTRVIEARATVTALDAAKRGFTLTDEQGNQRTLIAPAEMINYDQLKVGDKVLATYAEEQVVYLGAPGAQADAAGAALVAAAPQGAKPGMVAADTLELTALVKGIDTTLHTATLEFSDGTRREVKVRPDVELKTEYLGRLVLIRLTSALAIGVVPQ